MQYIDANALFDMLGECSYCGLIASFRERLYCVPQFSIVVARFYFKMKILRLDKELDYIPEYNCTYTACA